MENTVEGNQKLVTPKATHQEDLISTPIKPISKIEKKTPSIYKTKKLLIIVTVSILMCLGVIIYKSAINKSEINSRLIQTKTAVFQDEGPLNTPSPISTPKTTELDIVTTAQVTQITPKSILKTCIKWNPGNYVLVDLFNNPNRLDSLLSEMGNNFKGVEVPVLWSKIETSEGVYDFQYIDSIMNSVKASNKQVFFFVSERAFNSDILPVPEYIVTDKKYGGGAYKFSGNGQIAAVWNEAVQLRFFELIRKLGERYDSQINFEGIIFPESALNITPLPIGATQENYSKYVLRRVEIAKQAFPTSIVLQGFNWGLEKIIPQHAMENKVGFHGPDLVPDSQRLTTKKRIPAYDFYPEYSGKIPLAVDVQSPVLKHNGEWGDFSLEEIYKMGVETLKVNYIFWADLNWGKNYKNFSEINKFISEKGGNFQNVSCPSSIGVCCN